MNDEILDIYKLQPGVEPNTYKDKWDCSLFSSEQSTKQTRMDSRNYEWWRGKLTPQMQIKRRKARAARKAAQKSKRRNR